MKHSRSASMAEVETMKDSVRGFFLGDSDRRCSQSQSQCRWPEIKRMLSIDIVLDPFSFFSFCCLFYSTVVCLVWWSGSVIDRNALPILTVWNAMKETGELTATTTTTRKKIRWNNNNNELNWQNSKSSTRSMNKISRKMKIKTIVSGRLGRCSDMSMTK